LLAGCSGFSESTVQHFTNLNYRLLWEGFPYKHLQFQVRFGEVAIDCDHKLTMEMLENARNTYKNFKEGVSSRHPKSPQSCHNLPFALATKFVAQFTTLLPKLEADPPHGRCIY